MDTKVRIMLRGALLCALLALAGIAARAQETDQHFTVIVARDVPCDVTICYFTADGGVCSVFSGGTNITGGTGPFTVLDVNGTPHAINDRIGCLYSFNAAPGCCVDICYTIDQSGMPAITVTRANMPACPD